MEYMDSNRLTITITDATFNLGDSYYRKTIKCCNSLKKVIIAENSKKLHKKSIIHRNRSIVALVMDNFVLLLWAITTNKLYLSCSSFPRTFNSLKIPKNQKIRASSSNYLINGNISYYSSINNKIKLYTLNKLKQNASINRINQRKNYREKRSQRAIDNSKTAQAKHLLRVSNGNYDGNLLFGW